MTLLPTTPGPAHRSRSGAARARGLLVNLGLGLVMLVALAFLLPSLMGLQRYVIMGGSMDGTYDLGSVVFEEVVPVSELAVGDVITNVPPAESGIDTLVTHRIVSIDGADLRTQGDANPAVDPWTFQLTAATQPRVVAPAPYVGFAFMALADRGTRMALIGLPAALIALWSLVELARALRPRRTPDDGPAGVVPTRDPEMACA
ncbi:signal peptidase I [uncultured Nocardioides sp.]|uniref:signal peptidase I n=1 Tax=uncultured Nocardioides sp. TaxID=198441 RepID=UPI0026042059|nr:signal peptidase I [uncultured Nocardioides sp.]